MYSLLIVEDEELTRWGLEKEIPWHEMEFEVAAVAENGISAVNLLCSGLKPDVLLTDIRMPDMDGLDLMEWLKNRDLNIKVVILSGFSDFEYARKGIECGAYAYLLKPTKDEELKKVFAKLKKDMDRERSRDTEFDSVMKKAGRDAVFHKEIILKELLEGHYENEKDDDLDQTMKELDIETGGYYGVMIFDLYNPRKEVKSKLVFLKEKLTQIVNNTVIAVQDMRILYLLFEENSSGVTVLVRNSKKPDIKDILLAAEKAKSCIEEFMAKNCSYTSGLTAAVGVFYDNIGKAGVSCMQARDILKKSFFFRKGTVLSLNDFVQKVDRKCDSTNDPYKKEGKLLVENIFKSLSLYDEKSVQRYLNRYFEILKNLVEYDTEKLHMQIMELIIQLSARLAEMNMDFRIICGENIHMDIRQIINCQIYSNLIEYVMKIFLKVLGYMKINERNAESPVDRAKRYIERNIGRKITLEELAELVFLNPVYFSAYFKQKAGCSFKEYQTSYRMEKARSLLKMTDMKVYEVSKIVGYTDFRHFSRIFRKYENMSPFEYKHQQGNMMEDS